MRHCFVVPGILGSTLYTFVGPQGKLWVNVSRLSLGQVGKLRLAPNGVDPGPPDGVDCFSGEPLEDYYNRLAVRLQRDLGTGNYQVLKWGYDWRKSIRSVGQDLAAEVRRVASPAEPCSIVAHSQGGLIARAAWFNLGNTGETNLVRRIVTLGTPHQGSYAPVVLWCGSDELITAMTYVTTAVRVVIGTGGALIGVRQWTPLDLVQLCATWPALYELLPLLGSADAAADPWRVEVFNSARWPAARQINDFHLQASKDSFGPFLRSAASMPPPWVLTTVAGYGLETAAQLARPDLLGQLGALEYTDQGDGRVTVSSALVPASSRYLIASGHANLTVREDVLEELAAWVLEERSPPTPVPPTRSIAGPLVQLVAGPPFVYPVGAVSHRCDHCTRKC